MSTKTNQTKTLAVRRLVLNAVLIALYYALGLWRIPIGNMWRVSVAPFAVILGALAFGPVDGLIVGLMGEFVTQILGPYGLTPTTLLWCLGEAVHGLTLGLFAWLVLKKWLVSEKKLSAAQMVMVLCACISTAILSSLCNTLALYVDSKMFGYYSYAMVFGALVVRLILSVVISGVLGYVALPVLSALRRAKLL